MSISFFQIRNSIDGKVLTLINHCELVKELMDYLEFVYFGKGNISRIFNVCRAFYRSEKQDQSLTEFFIDYKKKYEELNVPLPFSLDVKYDFVKAQILSNPEVSSFQEMFN